MKNLKGCIGVTIALVVMFVASFIAYFIICWMFQSDGFAP